MSTSSVREGRDVAHHGGDRLVVVAEEIAEANHAKGAVEIAFGGHRRTRVAGLQQQGQCLAARCVGIDDHDLVSRHHHLVECPFGDLEGTVDDLALLGWEVLVDRDHVAQFLTADLLALQGRVAAEHTNRDVGRPRQHPDHRLRERRQQVERPSHRRGPILGALHGEPLRGEFAEHQREVGEDQRDDDDRRRPCSSAKEAEPFFEGLGERHRQRQPTPGIRRA